MSSPQSDGREAFLGALDVHIDLPLAAFPSRAMAYFVDLLLLVLADLILILVASMLLAFDPDSMGWIVAGGLLGYYLLEWSYFVVAEQLMDGQTPGKRAMHLRTVQSDGAPVGLMGSLVRNLLRPIDTLFGGAIAMISTVVTVRHQRLGDLAAGTVVVIERQAPEASYQPTRFPDGIAPEDLALIEAWFAREQGLVDFAHTALATELADWIDTQHPGFLAEGGEPGKRLVAGFSPELRAPLGGD